MNKDKKGRPLRVITSALMVCFQVYLANPSGSALEAAGFGSGSGPSATAGLSSLVASPATQKYRIDASQSRFMVHAAVSGLFSALGHDHNIAIRNFAGEAQVTADSISPASLQLTIKSDSLAVTDKVSASDREKIESTMRQEVLDVGKYPEIAFTSTSVDVNKTGEGQYEASIWGELSLHGVTKKIWLAARLTLTGNSLRAKGEFPVRQTDYNIKPVSVGGGTVKVKNDLKLSFEIVAHKG